MRTNTYKMLEYVTEDDYGSVIGHIIIQDGKFISAEIIDDIITDTDELNQIRAFLDVVEKKMGAN
jgi:hypothetical protein